MPACTAYADLKRIRFWQSLFWVIIRILVLQRDAMMYIPIAIQSKKLFFWISVFFVTCFLTGALVLFLDSGRFKAAQRGCFKHVAAGYQRDAAPWKKF